MQSTKLTMAAMLLAVAADSGWAATIVYNDFSSTAGLTINGNAAKVGNVLRLTPASFNQGGSAFSTSQTTLGVGNSFSTYFQFQITGSGGTFDDAVDHLLGADGLVFVVQPNSNSVGGIGVGIGYAGIPNSLGVEFDTFYNNPGQFGGNDPDGNHVGVDLAGSLSSTTLKPEPTLFNNGQIWNVWIDYNGTTQSLEGRWSLGNSRPIAAQISANVDLVSVIGGTSAFVGFTSGTGASYGNHDILSWEFRDSFNPIGRDPVVPEPTSFALAGLAGIGMSIGAWRRRSHPAA